MSETFESSLAPEPVGAFPHAKRVGNLLILSEIGPRVRGSKDIRGVTLAGG
jgi:2-aminomuconate deaminase